MKINYFFCALLMNIQAVAAPRFVPEEPLTTSHYQINASTLCATAKETLAYLNKGSVYDPQVIHEGTVFQISLQQIKRALVFICQHQNQMNDPSFIRKHFNFVRWYQI